MFLLEVRDLSCSVAGQVSLTRRKKHRPVLHDITLRIAQESIVGLLGGSGAGKSTLARCIAGLHMPDGGTITVEGTQIVPHGSYRRPADLAIQLLFQSSGSSLDPLRSIEDTLNEAIEAVDIPGIDGSEAIRELISSVGLSEEHLRRKPHQLSGGQRQRVAIARVLAVRPKLLILDEPTSSLDTITQSRVLSLLLSLKKTYRFAVLFITHDVPLALSLCDRIAILHEGRIIEEGETQEVQSDPRHAYTRALLHASLRSGLPAPGPQSSHI